MAVNVSDPMGGSGTNSLDKIMRDVNSETPGDAPCSGVGDDANPVQPSYSWEDKTMNQIYADDDKDGDLDPSTEGPGQPPL